MKFIRHASRPVLRYPGAKWRIADWIVNFFPRHDVYVEPFFGSGAVFFTKNPSGTETINDIDGNVVNLFRVIRDDAEALCRAVEMTPYAREEYGSCCVDNCVDNSVDKARRFLVRTWQGFGGKTRDRSGWAHDRTNTVFRPKYWNELPGKILNTVERLKTAQIECMDALELIPLYNRRGTLMYVDPPYLRNVRTNLHYAHEFATPAEHEKLLNICKQHVGPCIISSYENEMYDKLLAGWEKKTIQTQTNCAKTATECIYINPVCSMEPTLF